MLLTILIIWAVFACVFAIMRLVQGLVFLPLCVLFRLVPHFWDVRIQTASPYGKIGRTLLKILVITDCALPYRTRALPFLDI